MLTLDHPDVTDDHRPYSWTGDPARPAFAAEVVERWMVTARMHPRRFRELVPAPFLEADLVDGSLLLNLCAVRLRPAEREPGGLGAGLLCALRIACRASDGTPCAWIARRHTGLPLATAMLAAGLPQVTGGLVGSCAADRLELIADDGLLEARVGPGHGPVPHLFPDAAAAAARLSAPMRSYTTSTHPGRWTEVELQHRGGDACDLCRGWEGWLRTPWGDCTIDGVYRMPGGQYRWVVSGEVDEHARIV
jgi:hypothetical protein